MIRTGIDVVMWTGAGCPVGNAASGGGSGRNGSSVEKFYCHASDIYCVAALTDQAGSVVERYRYDTYGRAAVLDASGNPKSDPNFSGYGNPWTFTGRRLDAETALLYYRNRAYAPLLGRFINREPATYTIGPDLPSERRGLQREGMMPYTALYRERGLSGSGAVRIWGPFQCAAGMLVLK
ncbi:MAG: hypothetical protein N3A38_10745 [Planctomycetota bacterium]|nr:hypothetical protein [Planctomycetota bacterium]